MKRASLVLAFTVAVLAGCGGDGDTKTVTVNGSGGESTSTTAGTGTLADTPKQEGEVVVQGDGPQNFGPYEFQAGVYTVKFEQFDPENPRNDFGSTTSSSFIVFLDRQPGVITDADSQVVFHNFGRDGETQKTLPGGPFYVDVTNADHSYMVRLTPQ